MAMPEENQNEVVQEGDPREPHAAEEALHNQHDADTAEAALRGEHIAGEDLSPRQKAKKLRKLTDEELVALAEQATRAEHWLDVARRGQAELDNTIKRLRREQQDAARYEGSAMARDLLPVIDNLSRALEAGATARDFDSLHAGVELIRKMFIDALARHDVTPIPAEGTAFDPAFHEALMMDSRDDTPDNVVTAELERGWKMHDRVLRASKVRVNKRG